MTSPARLINTARLAVRQTGVEGKDFHILFSATQKINKTFLIFFVVMQNKQIGGGVFAISRETLIRGRNICVSKSTNNRRDFGGNFSHLCHTGSAPPGFLGSQDRMICTAPPTFLTMWRKPLGFVVAHWVPDTP